MFVDWYLIKHPMKIKILTLLLTFCVGISAYGQEIILYPALKKQVDSLALLDKIAGHNNMTNKERNRDSLNKVFRQITVSNTGIIKRIFEKYGFLDYDMLGKDGSNNFWLMVQHADNDLPFQKAVLTKMKIAVANKKANGQNFAYLTDRVNINSGNPQVYGTQMAYKPDGTPVPKNLADPDNVDKRRKEVGLQPLADYIKFINQPIPQK
jgi:hypothetical protein